MNPALQRFRFALLALALAACSGGLAAEPPTEARAAVAEARKNSEKADASYRRALELMPGDEHRASRHAVLLQIADIAVAESRHSEAIGIGESVIQEAGQAGDYVTLARALDHLGYAYRVLGDFDSAKQAHERSRDEVVEAIADLFARQNARVRALHLLGFNEAERAEDARWRHDDAGTRESFKRAEDYLHDALRAAEPLDGLAAGRQWSFSEGLEANPKQRVAGIAQMMSTVKLGLGTLLEERADYLEAEQMARLAVDRSPADSRDRASSLHYLARVQARQGKYDDAIVALEAAESIWEKLGRPYNIAYAYQVRAGEVYAKLPDKRAQTLEFYDKARAVFLRAGRCNDIAAMDFLAGRTLEQLDKKADAKDRYLASIELYERLRDRQKPRERLAFFSLRLRPYEALIRLLLESWRSTGDPRDAEMAFRISERSRARSLLDTMYAATRPEAATPVPSSGCDPRTMPAPKDKAVAERASGLAAAEELTVKEVQSVLRPGEVLAEYFVGDAASYAFVVGEDGLHVVKLAATKRELVQGMRALNEPLARVAAEKRYQPLVDYDLAESHRLYKALLEPLEPHLRQARRLVIVPHRTLFYLPFEALVADPRGADLQRRAWRNFERVSYFVDRTPPIRYALSASVLLLVASGEAAPDSGAAAKMLAILNPLHHDRKTFPPLREFEKMWPELKKRFSGIVDGRGARGTKDLFFGEGASSELVIFGAHGVFHEEEPMQSRIVLSGGDLKAQDILDWGEKVPARLITLAACQLGLGKLREGEGLVGLTRTLQLAGTRRIVASLWSVDVKPTASLVVALHQAIANAGVPQDEEAALLEAKKHVRNSNRSVTRSLPVPLAHPFFWAGMVMH